MAQAKVGASAAAHGRSQRRRGARRRPSTAQRCAWGLVPFMIFLPLQWQSLGHGPMGNIRYFHVAAVLMLLIARPSTATLRTATKMAQPVFPAAAVVVILGTCTSIGWHSGATQYLQAAYYICFGLVAAACLLVALTDPAAQRILVLAAPATIIVFLFELTLSAHRAGVNIVSAVRTALAGNPHVLQFGVFRAAFASVAPDARANLRHEIFGALLVVCCVGVSASARSGFARRTMLITTLATGVLVVLSLSRSVTLALALAAVVAVARLVITSRIKVGTFVLGLAGLAVVPYAIVKALPLLSARFSATDSYDARLAAVGQLSAGIGERMLIGGPIPSTSTQNLVLDAVLRAGLVAGLAALVIEAVFVILGVRAVALFWRTGSMAALAAVGAAMQLLVRSLTGGQNLMHQVQWFALGLLIAVLYRGARPATDKPDSARNGRPTVPGSVAVAQ